MQSSVWRSSTLRPPAPCRRSGDGASACPGCPYWPGSDSPERSGRWLHPGSLPMGGQHLQRAAGVDGTLRARRREGLTAGQPGLQQVPLLAYQLVPLGRRHRDVLQGLPQQALPLGVAEALQLQRRQFQRGIACPRDGLGIMGKLSPPWGVASTGVICRVRPPQPAAPATRWQQTGRRGVPSQATGSPATAAAARRSFQPGAQPVPLHHPARFLPVHPP
jgi:hypothetical protein